MILDAHCHLGRDVVYDFTVTEEQLLSVHSAHGITGGIVQPTITRPYLSEARPLTTASGALLIRLRENIGNGLAFLAFFP